MSVKINIQDQKQLIPGEKTPVRFVVNFDKATKVRGIRALFWAAERTEATYVVTTTDSKGKVKTETRTAVEHVDIAKESFLLRGQERKRFFSRLGDSLATWVGKGEHEKIGPGECEFHVDIAIPKNAPASFKGKKCEVFYRLKVEVDLPIKLDKSETQQFDVPPVGFDFDQVKAVHVTFPDESGRSFWDKTFGKKVTLNLAVDRDAMHPGEKGLAMLTVEAEDTLKVDQIEAKLVGTESSNANGHSDRHVHLHPLGDVQAPNIISSETVHEFDILIPEIEGPLTQTGKNFDIDWSIQVQLKIPWAKDPVIQVPIRIVPRTSDATA